MSKVAAYLRGHISGEVSTRDDVRAGVATDGGVLAIKPELVIYPRNTNDIRKVARFAWQLAEKGHVLPLTVRGGGTDDTGASIGKGAIIATTAHMNKVFEYDAKQRLVRLQPGASVGALQSALALQGTSIMALAGSHPGGTVGGAIASAVAGPLAGKYGTIQQSVDQLEVVLANGEVLQTGRISKRELSRKKGLQGFEGDISRGIDGIIEEYEEILPKLAANDTVGYNTIADVKRKDGSFDLTPLFVGSQGTLGVISEVILRAEHRNPAISAAALAFADSNAARDALDELAGMRPALLEYYDAELFDAAAKLGRTYKFYTEASEAFVPQSVVLVAFDEFNAHQRKKNTKKVAKLYEKADGVHVVCEDDAASELLAALDVAYYTAAPDKTAQSPSGLYGGLHIPTAQLEKFAGAVAQLAAHEHVTLPMAGHVITNTYTVYPTLSLDKVADKQKLFKLLDALTKLVYQHGGTMVAEGGEGRLKARGIYAELDEKVVAMYEAVRKVCDPLGTLNPGVKQVNDVRTVATQLKAVHTAPEPARVGL